MSNSSFSSRTSLFLILSLIIGAVIGYYFTRSIFQQQVKSNESQISELTNQINTQTSTIFFLEQDFEDSEKKVTELFDEIELGNLLIEVLEQENEEYNSQIVILENNISNYQYQILNLNAIIAEYEENSSHGGIEYESEYNISILRNQEYYRSLKKDLRNAQRNITVHMYSMIYDFDDSHDWANNLIKELVSAKNRGVNVLVLLEYRTRYGWEIDNIEAYTYLTDNGVDVRLDYEDDTDHLKYVLIDTSISYIGSHNWSESGLYYNNEVSVKLIENLPELPT
jgi:uncharacterized protein YneF (UPF0154 family)